MAKDILQPKSRCTPCKNNDSTYFKRFAVSSVGFHQFNTYSRSRISTGFPFTGRGLWRLYSVLNLADDGVNAHYDRPLIFLGTPILSPKTKIGKKH